MKKIIGVVSLTALLCCAPAFAKGSRGGSRSRSASVPRVQYSGAKHTESHGGQYAGGQGSSHKGGSYQIVRVDTHYGQHKKN